MCLVLHTNLLHFCCTSTAEDFSSSGVTAQSGPQKLWQLGLPSLVFSSFVSTFPVNLSWFCPSYSSVLHISFAHFLSFYSLWGVAEDDTGPVTRLTWSWFCLSCFSLCLILSHTSPWLLCLGGVVIVIHPHVGAVLTLSCWSWPLPSLHAFLKNSYRYPLERR